MPSDVVNHYYRHYPDKALNVWRKTDELKPENLQNLDTSFEKTKL